MYCNSCGNPNPDGSAFCMACGKKLPVTVSAQAPVSPSPAASTPPATVALTGSDRMTRSKQFCDEFSKCFYNTWREMATSSLMLVFIIVYSLSVAISAFQAFEPATVLGELQYYLRISSSDMVSVSVLLFCLQIPGIFIAIGMWIQYAEGHNGTGAINTAGLSLVKGGAIANAAMIGLGLVVLLFASCSGDSYYLRNLQSVLIVSILFGGGFGVFYLYLVLTVVSNAKEAAETAYPCADKITVLAVFQFIAAGISVISLLSTGTLDWATVLSIGLLILSGIVLLQLKETMEVLQNTRIKMEREAKQPAKQPATHTAQYMQKPAWARVAEQPTPQAQPVPTASYLASPPVAAASPSVVAPSASKETVTQCAYCGTRNTENWIFCPGCGKSFTDE